MNTKTETEPQQGALPHDEATNRIRKVRRQFLLFGVIPLCLGLILGELGKSRHDFLPYAVILVIPFFIMTWIFSKSLGLKTWQAALLLGVVLIFKNIAVFLIATILLLSKSIDMCKVKAQAAKTESTPKPLTLKERLAAEKRSAT